MLEFHKLEVGFQKCLYPATEEIIREKRQRDIEVIYEWEDKNTKRHLYKKILDATVDYDAAKEIGPPPAFIVPPKKHN
jgi:hypothetical protein